MTSRPPRGTFFPLISVYKFSCYLPSKAISITTLSVQCCSSVQSVFIPMVIGYVHIFCGTVAVFVMLKAVARVFTFLR
jgi:hypothetical protein